jgi:hypothetical protein
VGFHELEPAVVTLCVAAAGWLFVRRHGGGSALEELERANRILERRVGELEQENNRQAGELATLRSRTDVGLAIAPVLEALKLHEERAGERSSRTLDVLDLIARRLGPEAEAA